MMKMVGVRSGVCMCILRRDDVIIALETKRAIQGVRYDIIIYQRNASSLELPHISSNFGLGLFVRLED